MFENTWPTNGPARLSPRDDGTFEIIPAFELPAINTLILLSSGVTVTIAHHALLAGQRSKTITHVNTPIHWRPVLSAPVSL